MVAQGDPSTPGNLCFVSPADRTAGEFDLTTTCPGTVPIRVLVSPSLPPSHSLSLSLSLSLPAVLHSSPHVPRCALAVYMVRANFGNGGFGAGLGRFPGRVKIRLRQPEIAAQMQMRPGRETAHHVRK